MKRCALGGTKHKFSLLNEARKNSNWANRSWISLFAIAALGVSHPEAGPVDRNLLWNIVNFKCLRHLTKSEAPIRVTVSTYRRVGIGASRFLRISTA